MTRTPIPDCPQPETPLRERAWTDEQRPPARPVVVSDAECLEFIRQLPTYCASVPIEIVRAALTNFAKGERHE